MTIIFHNPVKQGVHQLIAGVPLAFADARAEEYFLAAGWAAPSDLDPAHTYPAGSFDIPADATHADGPNKGQPILSAPAQAEG